ncbi:MAG TPA: gamma carbonic anhydrase family protein [Actinocrinis sp.]|uniref:gamma carbonic anhydrase family protein n=1 Tax=Actinocrinis sp. TaxID=1920516 RepID=UPI002D738424|nr:gamma carbonic anhydrase family protein [Actinocrinis sp.]HZU57021.1 gamma carbonic anhydrase family protein [Actinocrinis sp.]
MLIEHRGRSPVVPASAYVAPTAVLCGAVALGERARILHCAVLSAEDGEVHIGADTVVMEHALIRGRAGHDALIGDAVLIGPHAHVNGAVVEEEVFIAAGDPARLFSPDQHDELWEVQRDLDFPGTVYGVTRDTPMRAIMARQTEFYGAHREDRIINE